MTPLKVYEVQCTGIPVGYLTIDETSTWGQQALREIGGLGGLIWLIPKDSSCLKQFVNDNYKGERDGLDKV